MYSLSTLYDTIPNTVLAACCKQGCAEKEGKAEPEEDSNTDHCVLCNLGGSLLCCDGCAAAYHLRCLGETGKGLPEGEWLCPECSLGGRGLFCLFIALFSQRDPTKLPCDTPWGSNIVLLTYLQYTASICNEGLAIPSVAVLKLN